MSHYKNTIKKAKILSVKFPDIEFRGICLQPFNEIVFQVHRMMGLSAEKQLSFINFDNASKKWVISLLNRAIIIDKRGKIIDGFANFSSSNFEDLLKKI